MQHCFTHAQTVQSNTTTQLPVVQARRVSCTICESFAQLPSSATTVGLVWCFTYTIVIQSCLRKKPSCHIRRLFIQSPQGMKTAPQNVYKAVAFIRSWRDRWGRHFSYTISCQSDRTRAEESRQKELLSSPWQSWAQCYKESIAVLLWWPGRTHQSRVVQTAK